MKDDTIVRHSSSEIEAMINRGEDRTDIEFLRSHEPDEELSGEFWANAVLVEPANRKSVHLRLQPDVFDFFIKQTGGKGHTATMQAVLKAYADAHS